MRMYTPGRFGYAHLIPWETVPARIQRPSEPRIDKGPPLSPCGRTEWLVLLLLLLLLLLIVRFFFLYSLSVTIIFFSLFSSHSIHLFIFPILPSFIIFTTYYIHLPFLPLPHSLLSSLPLIISIFPSFHYLIPFIPLILTVFPSISFHFPSFHSLNPYCPLFYLLSILHFPPPLTSHESFLPSL